MNDVYCYVGVNLVALWLLNACIENRFHLFMASTVFINLYALASYFIVFIHSKPRCVTEDREIMNPQKSSMNSVKKQTIYSSTGEKSEHSQHSEQKSFLQQESSDELSTSSRQPIHSLSDESSSEEIASQKCLTLVDENKTIIAKIYNGKLEESSTVELSDTPFPITSVVNGKERVIGYIHSGQK